MSNLAFDMLMFKAQLRENFERHRQCPETSHGSHGDPDKNGRCPFCRRKIDFKAMMQPLSRYVKSDLDLAYGYMYDPDFGNDYRDKY